MVEDLAYTVQSVIRLEFPSVMHHHKNAEPLWRGEGTTFQCRLPPPSPQKKPKQTKKQTNKTQKRPHYSWSEDRKVGTYLPHWYLSRKVCIGHQFWGFLMCNLMNSKAILCQLGFKSSWVLQVKFARCQVIFLFHFYTTLGHLCFWRSCLFQIKFEIKP